MSMMTHNPSITVTFTFVSFPLWLFSLTSKKNYSVDASYRTKRLCKTHLSCNKKKNASTTVHLQVSACTNSLTSVTQSASMCLCVSILVYNSTLCCPGNNKSERQRWIFSILKETDWRTPQRGAEKSCGLHCAISLSTRRHTFAQASVLCPLSVRGGYVTVAIV